MPADLVTGQDAEDVATYVASVAGVPGSEAPAARRRPSCSPRSAASATRSRPPGRPSTTGPDLDEALAGQDAAFIEESIVDPNAEIAQGFQPDVMPQDFGTTLTARGPQGPGRLPARQRRRSGGGSRPRRGRALGLEVDDHVGDRERDLAPRALDHAALEPPRALRRMGRDDHLVGGERRAARPRSRRWGRGGRRPRPGPRGRRPHRRQRPVEAAAAPPRSRRRRRGRGARAARTAAPGRRPGSRCARGRAARRSISSSSARPPTVWLATTSIRWTPSSPAATSAVCGSSPASCARSAPTPTAISTASRIAPTPAPAISASAITGAAGDPDDHHEPEHLGLGTERVVHRRLLAFPSN